MQKLSIFIPNLEMGGAEKNAVLIANEFVEKGFNVDMVLLDAKGALINKLDKRVRLVDLKCKFRKFIYFELKKYFLGHQVDSVLVFMFPLTFITTLVCKIYSPKTKVVVTERTTYSKSFFKTKKLNFIHRMASKIMMNLCYPFADAVVLVSKEALKQLKKFLFFQNSKINYHVIYNPVQLLEPKEFSLPKECLSWYKSDAFKILAVGRLRKEKNYPLLLKAFKLLLQKVDATLMILGEGPERHFLENLISTMGLQDKVFFPGTVIETEFFYKKADLFVLSSDVEGFPNVLLEALTYGKNIVSTDCLSGPREILNDGQYGKLTKMDDTQEFCFAMLELLQNPMPSEQQLNRAAYFSVDKTILEFQNLLFPSSSIKEL